MKILTIIGARPQFIKASVVSCEFSKRGVEEILLHTGQHYDANMSEIFFEELKIPKPKYRFSLQGTTHAQMTSEMLVNCEEVMLEEMPDMVLLYGDTNSTLSGALAASKLNIPIIHIEAGLRSFNNKMPEEINRIITDRISTLLFCPTEKSISNLKDEGIKSGVFEVGDVMQDVALKFQKFAKKPKIKIEESFMLATVHRAENSEDCSKMRSIFDALIEIAKTTQVILPLHPRAKKIVENLNIDTKRVVIIEPLSFFEMLWLLRNCKIVLTDSGGLQKEAYFHKKPCITLREESEWVETIENNYNILVGANREKILKALNHKFNTNYSKRLYGDGDAAVKIVGKILEIYR